MGNVSIELLHEGKSDKRNAGRLSGFIQLSKLPTPNSKLLHFS